MPVGKYHCDYCEKEFQDTPSARKRHLQSSHHQRARALWYSSFSSAAPPATPPQGLCHRFLRTGFCPYGDGCKYLHPKQPVPHPPHLPIGIGAQSAEMMQPHNLSGKQPIGNPISGGDALTNHMGIFWGNLPPSLRPPPEEGYPTLPFIDWG